ncbi:phosphoribosyltransferase [Peptococcaceae bacterium]|nr:phosphoribosyltransferase [Peptococcaceae bacterium]
MYINRLDAGQKLAEILSKSNYDNGLVVAIPRGGVVPAWQIAKKLKLPLDIIIPRKIGAPHNPELAVGAVTQDGGVLLDWDLLQKLQLTENKLKPQIDKALIEVRERLKKYRGDRPLPDFSNRDVIICDDGIATGSTIKAAIKSIKAASPKRTILAVPVAPRDTLETLTKEVDQIVCPLSPEFFMAVGQFYQDFDQVEDEEVIRLLKEQL